MVCQRTVSVRRSLSLKKGRGLVFYFLFVCFILFVRLLYMNDDFACMFVFTPHEYLVLAKTRASRSPGSRVKQLWASTWVLGIETGSSGRVVSTLNHDPYLQPQREGSCCFPIALDISVVCEEHLIIFWHI